MRTHLEDFILHLATERGLSENYQLSTRRSLESFADWAEKGPRLSDPRTVELAHLHDFLVQLAERLPSRIL